MASTTGKPLHHWTRQHAKKTTVLGSSGSRRQRHDPHPEKSAQNYQHKNSSARHHERWGRSAQAAATDDVMVIFRCTQYTPETAVADRGGQKKHTKLLVNRLNIGCFAAGSGASFGCHASAFESDTLTKQHTSLAPSASNLNQVSSLRAASNEQDHHESSQTHSMTFSRIVFFILPRIASQEF